MSVVDSASGMDLFFSDEGCLQISINKWGTVFNSCSFCVFLFSSQTDFIHTVCLAIHDRIWSLVLFGKKSSLISIGSPHVSHTCWEKIKCLLRPHRCHNIARSAELWLEEHDHFC